ncbi:intracellular protein transport protein USO1, partial [Reticulomyxa filosa]
ICLICKQVANNPMEIDCCQHKSIDELLIVGENCLKQFLSKNPNSCPIDNHNNCLYSQNRLAKRYINELDVICPRQFELEQTATQQGHEEGETPEFVSCNFRGKVKQMNDHLEHSCCLQMVKCWFESFGCNHSCLKSAIHDHLTSNMKLHFDLVIKSFDTLQQTIRQYQDEIRKLKMENERLKVELQLKRKKDKEISNLKQQLEQYQKGKKTTLVDMEKLKKDIESKDNEIQKIKQKMQVKEKQKKSEEKNKQINDNKEEQKENTMNDNSSTSISNTSTTSNFKLERSFKLLKTFTGHTGNVWSIDYSTFDDCQFICSGSQDKTVRVWDVDNNKQIQSFNEHSNYVYCAKFSSYHYHNHHQN